MLSLCLSISFLARDKINVKYVLVPVTLYFVIILSSDHLKWIDAIYLPMFFMVASMIYGQPRHRFSAIEIVLKDSIKSVYF